MIALLTRWQQYRAPSPLVWTVSADSAITQKGDPPNPSKISCVLYFVDAIDLEGSAIPNDICLF